MSSVHNATTTVNGNGHTDQNNGHPTAPQPVVESSLYSAPPPSPNGAMLHGGADGAAGNCIVSTACICFVIDGVEQPIQIAALRDLAVVQQLRDRLTTCQRTVVIGWHSAMNLDDHGQDTFGMLVAAAKGRCLFRSATSENEDMHPFDAVLSYTIDANNLNQIGRWRRFAVQSGCNYLSGFGRGGSQQNPGIFQRPPFDRTHAASVAAGNSRRFLWRN